jgi:hypothetical protein
VLFEKVQGVFGWSLTFEKAAVSCGLWKSYCEKVAVEKAEDHLVRAAVSCGKLCALWVKYL